MARSTSGCRIVKGWDWSLNADGNHRAAAETLAVKLKWFGDWRAATLNEYGNVYICVSEPATETGFEANPL